MTVITQMSTRLTHPIQVQVFESNQCDDPDYMGDLFEIHTLTHLCGWLESEIECYVSSRAMVAFALEAFAMDIVSGHYNTRVFKVDTVPFPGAEPTGEYTRYILTALPKFERYETFDGQIEYREAR